MILEKNAVVMHIANQTPIVELAEMYVSVEERNEELQMIIRERDYEISKLSHENYILNNLIETMSRAISKE